MCYKVLWGNLFQSGTKFTIFTSFKTNLLHFLLALLDPVLFLSECSEHEQDTCQTLPHTLYILLHHPKYTFCLNITLFSRNKNKKIKFSLNRQNSPSKQ